PFRVYHQNIPCGGDNYNIPCGGYYGHRYEETIVARTIVLSFIHPKQPGDNTRDAIRRNADVIVWSPCLETE
ncbi:MAG: hypothetical protein ACI88G_002246, partial [Woeseiaceae bacterium]